MKHFATARFWRCYRKLPTGVREQSDRSFALLRNDPSHRSLQLKRIGQFWSARVGLHYRALAVEAANGDLVWFWIGSHGDYDTLVGRRVAGKRTQPARAKPQSKPRAGRTRD